MSGDDACYDAPEVRFTFGASAETVFGPCEVGEVPGFAISVGANQTVAASIHGDHLFFTGFPEGDEGGVRRLAQWLADCDLNLDGTVTKEELEAISPSQLPQIDERYQLGGSPITPVENMYDYVRSQLKTQGHYQGEGECPVDGVAHAAVHADAHFVALAHVEIDVERVVRVLAHRLEHAHEARGSPELPVRRRHRHCRHMAVPAQSMHSSAMCMPFECDLHAI